MRVFLTCGDSLQCVVNGLITGNFLRIVSLDLHYHNSHNTIRKLTNTVKARPRRRFGLKVPVTFNFNSLHLDRRQYTSGRGQSRYGRRR